MLRVEGVEREPVELKGESLPSSRSGALEREDVEGLVEEFKRRMGVLKKVVGEGERRRDVRGREEEEEDAVIDGDESVERVKGKERADE